ncbi:MAG: dihydrolipoyl dehydrogenase [Desulfobacteraceae bacterium]|jgi:dihydrolipoamide dehydrogenase|nr:dihydrolipoyl dehydrogenase [Desulfobacteraceae bacterium]
MVMGEFVQETELLVIGSGPGGYAAAFRAADLGLEVTMVDTAERPGGACLFRGCIPSKTLLHLSELLHDARRAGPMGITFGEPTIDLAAVRSWKSRVIDRLAGGLVSLCRQRGVQVIRGHAEFASSTQVRLHDAEVSGIKFGHCILATGSRPILLPGASAVKGGRVMTSTGALGLAEVPSSLLVVGGGYVGLELGSVYASLGSRVVLVELGDRLLPGTDPDLVEPLQRRLAGLFAGLHFNTRVTAIEEAETAVTATLESVGESRRERFERVLVAIGRQPNSRRLGLENTRVKLDAHGFVVVDAQQRTDDPRIFAIGDVVGGAMLAHKAIHEGKTAAEVVAGRPAAFDARAIPAVVYTDPQIAWCGLSEEAARREGREVRIARFPWKFSGRALTMDAPEGLTKILIDPQSGRILGVGMVGRSAEALIAEGVLAVEMGALAQDLALTVHAHPTLSETIEEADALLLGSATHILSPGPKG